MDITTDFSGLFTPQSDDLTFEALMDRVQELEERVAMQSIDRLTTVLSIDQFHLEVKRILKEYPEQNFVMWRFDIDKFQTVNNLFGVEEGNRLLVYCAKYLKSSLPSTRSTAIGRMGGDVFCGITPYSDSAMTSGEDGYHWITATSTIAGMESFFKGFRDDFRFSVSIGFYQIENHNDPIEILYSRALAATKACKDNSEKIYAFYDHNLNAAIEETQLITAEMHSALENGEFTVFLQPKVRLSDLSLVGAEALVRWIHPKKGRIPPDSFIPIFEENGFITKLDLYVLRRCCAYIQSWMRQGMNLIPLSVNLSQMDLSTPGLPSKILAVLDEYKVAAKYIHLEITESAYADDVEQVNGVTQAFKDLGFHLEMDDFGKGYSSLNMIAELPIDTLKLDMGFLQGDYQGGSGRVISFVTGLARHMDLVTVAEGIETQEQLAFLRSINCDCGQGYLFSRPLPKAEFDAYMRNCTIATMGVRKVKNVDRSVADYKGWNTEDIWEPESSFSKMFNAFAGGVGVCELNVLRNTFRLARYNQQLVEALHTTHEILKHHCDNLVSMIHFEDVIKVHSAMSAINDPKDWSKDTGVMTMDLRIKVLGSDMNSEGKPSEVQFTWVRLKWSLVDFTTDTRTYLVQMDNISEHYSKIEGMKDRLSKVDELERQMNIYSNAGLAGVATLFFDHDDQSGRGDILYANQQFFTLHSRDHLVENAMFPLTMDSFLSNESRELIRNNFKQEFEMGSTTFEWVLPLVDAEGVSRNTITNGRITRKEAGIYADIVMGTVNEVSSLEAKLSVSEERTSMIMSSTEVSHFDFLENKVFWGVDMQITFGLPPVQPLKSNGSFSGAHIFSPDSIDKVEEVLAELTQKEGSRTIECWMHNVNYVDYALRSLTFYSILDKNGQVSRISCVGRDVTRERYRKTNVTLSQIAQHTPDGLFVFAEETGKLLFANDEFYTISGVSKAKMEEEFKNYPLLLINDENYIPSAVIPELHSGDGVAFTRIAQLKNHSMRWIAMHGVRRGIYIYATVRDFTERKELEIQLDREMGFNEILNHITDELLFRINIQERTVYFSGKSTQNFGLGKEAYPFSMDTVQMGIIAQEYEDTFLEMVRDVVVGIEKSYTLQMKDKKGNVSWYRFEYRIIREAGDPAFAVGKAVNIDYEVGLLAKLERNAMTNCYNSAAMKMRSNQILNGSFPNHEELTKEGECAHALLVIDITNYFNMSNSISFNQRDEMIIRVSELITNNFRETDLVGHITEDQFVVFMKNVSIPTMPLQKVSDLYTVFRHNNTVVKPELKLDISIRCAYASRDGLNYATLLENAKVIPADIENF